MLFFSSNSRGALTTFQFDVILRLISVVSCLAGWRESVVGTQRDPRDQRVMTNFNKFRWLLLLAAAGSRSSSEAYSFLPIYSRICYSLLILFPAAGRVVIGPRLPAWNLE